MLCFMWEAPSRGERELSSKSATALVSNTIFWCEAQQKRPSVLFRTITQSQVDLLISKPRRSHARKSKATTELPERKPLHFDNLPDVATEHIVRFLLPDSKRNEWSSPATLETILSLVRSGGALRRVAQNAFRSVEFSVGHITTRKLCDIQILGDHKEVKHLMQALPAGIGEGIETMFVCAALSATFTRAIAKHCTGVRHLSFRPYCGSRFPNVNFCAIIAARGSGLEFLEVANSPGSLRLISCIAEHCRNLRHLKLDCGVIDTSLEPLWSSAGKNLQHLELGGCGYDPRLSLQRIFPNRPNIARLKYAFWGSDGRQEVEDLCQLYGSRLVELKVCAYNMELALLRIAEACPNILIDFPTSDTSTETVIGLGRASSMWDVYSVEDPAAFARVGVACSNLETIKSIRTWRLPSFSTASFSGLFGQPKPRLKYLDVSTGYTFDLDRSGSDMSDPHSRKSRCECWESARCPRDMLP